MKDMADSAVEEFLRTRSIGHLGLSLEGRTYVLPMFFGYDGDAVYFLSHPGQKDAYIEGTKEACLTVTEFRDEDDWESVQVFGPVERLTLNDEIRAAKAALMDVPPPPLPGTFPAGKPARSLEHVYYWRLTPVRRNGKRSLREPRGRREAGPAQASSAGAR